MSFEHHHNNNNINAVAGGRPLEMRDSAILDRMATSKVRSRYGQINNIINQTNNNNQNNQNNNNHPHRLMTPWGTDVLEEDNEHQQQEGEEDVPPNTSTNNINADQQQNHHSHHRQNNHPQDQWNIAGDYHCPEVSQTHNHFQNKESEWRDRKHQMNTSRINASHFGHGSGLFNENENQQQNQNQNRTTEDAAEQLNNTSSTTNTTSSQLAAISPPPEHRKLLQSKINDGHGIFAAREPGVVPIEKDRPGTPRIARALDSSQLMNSMSSSNNNTQQKSVPYQREAPFQPHYSRGAIKNPWNGYTDSKEKFGGTVDKTGFW